MAGTNDMEHAPLVDSIIKSARVGWNADGKRHASGDVPDVVDLIREISPRISSIRDEAVAAELDRHSTFFWDHAAMLETTWKPLLEQGEEDAAAILDGQIRLLREMSSRLSRRAAAVRGISEDELRARGILYLPTEQPTVEQPAVPAQITPTLDDGSFAFAVDPAKDPYAEGGNPVVISHMVCGEVATVPTLDDAVAWRNEHMPKCPGPPPAPAEPEQGPPAS